MGKGAGTRFCEVCGHDAYGAFSEEQCEICCLFRPLCDDCLAESLSTCASCKQTACDECTEDWTSQHWICCEDYPVDKCADCHERDGETKQAHGCFDCDVCPSGNIQLCPLSKGCKECKRKNSSDKLAQMDAAVLSKIPSASLHNEKICNTLHAFVVLYTDAPLPDNFSFQAAPADEEGKSRWRVTAGGLQKTTKKRAAEGSHDRQDAKLLFSIPPKLHTSRVRDAIANFVKEHHQTFSASPATHKKKKAPFKKQKKKV
jgi:hypothetical protein